MDLGLKDKVAVITGGSQGIGMACALVLIQEGCHIAFCALGQEAVDEAAKQIGAFGPVLGIEADVTRLEEIKGFVAKAADRFGRIDILVNNAGTGRLSDLLTFPDDEFQHNLDLMLFGVMRCAREVIPYMRKQGGGRIINMSSVFGKQPGGLVDYDAIKAAVIMYTKDLANYVAKDNILVNAVCPGPIRTPLWEGPGGLGEQLGKLVGMSGADAINWYAQQNIPLGHHGAPEDIANMVAFLASDKAKFITGQAINVDGGMVKVCV